MNGKAAKWEIHRPDPDSELIKRILKGDQTALGSLIEANKKFITSIIWSYVKNGEDIQDICQEVFIKIYRNLGRFANRSAFRTWAARITINECRLFYRKNKKHLNNLEYNPDIHITAGPGRDVTVDRLNGRDILSRVESVISGLTPEMQLLFRLRFVEEMNSSELSGVFKVPPGTIRSRLNKLRLNIMRHFKDLEGVLP